MSNRPTITPAKRAFRATLAAVALATPFAVASSAHAAEFPSAATAASSTLAVVGEPVVPEPSGAALAMVAAVPLLFRRRR